MCPLPEDDRLLLLHNPRCSKSRAVEALLAERGVTFERRLYLESPLEADELRELARRAGRPLLELTRTKQAEYADAGLSDAPSEEALVRAMVAHPILMERPVLVRGERAIVGRPPEAVLALLGD